MSSEDANLEDILYGDHRGAEPGFPEDRGSGLTDDVPPASTLQEPIMCAGCGEQVFERYFLLAASRAWHGACLCCSQCCVELQTQPSLYWRDGSVYCQRDYCRVFGIGRCARCLQPIPSSAMVMRSGGLTFHPQCFACQECNITLMPGNLYRLWGHKLYCEDCNAMPSHNHNAKAIAKQGDREEPVSSPEPQLDDSVSGVRAHRQNKRIRTCFRSEQLTALESYFAQKHNPDGRDWTCLAHKTGLPKRVLQVWFQNARAKMRRSLTIDDCPITSKAETMTTNYPSPTGSLTKSPLYHTSTIDQLQLSLLTNPLNNPPQSLSVDQSCGPNDSFLDYDTQGAPGWSAPPRWSSPQVELSSGELSSDEFSGKLSSGGALLK